MARRQLKSDIENSIDQIKERLLATRLDPRTTTLRELMENELRPEVYGPEKCRDRALTCRNSVAAGACPAQARRSPKGRKRQRGLRPHPSARARLATLRRPPMYLPGKARSAVIGLLWTNRAVGFVVVFMCAPQPQPQPQP